MHHRIVERSADQRAEITDGSATGAHVFVDQSRRGKVAAFSFNVYGSIQAIRTEPLDIVFDGAEYTVAKVASAADDFDRAQ